MEPYAWEWNAEALVLVPALALAYLAALRRFPASRPRLAAFVAGELLVLAVFATPVQSLALRYLLTMHLLQNVVLAEWAPALFVLALPPSLARRAHVPMLPALLLWLGTYFAWHVPFVYQAALERQTWLIHVEHACYFATGIVMWWPLVQDVPRRLASGARAAYAFAAFLFASPLGLLLALLPTSVYDFYVDARPRVWGLSPLADQQIAGVTMASEQAIVLFVVFLYWFRRFLAEEGAT